MKYAEFSMIRFGTGRSPYHAGPDTPDDLMQSLLDNSMVRRYPGLTGERVSNLQHDYAVTDQAARKKAKKGQKRTETDEERTARKREKGEREHVPKIAMRARISRALDDPTGFADRLAMFWSNHFSMRASNRFHNAMVEAFQEDVIRTYQRGRFADMLYAATLHPAMLIYLDQTSSIGPGSRLAVRTQKRQIQGLNENHARELLELHSMGVGGRYTQQDVRQLAELMTGLVVNKEYRFEYDTNRVEPGSETVLGTDYGGRRLPNLSELREFFEDLAVHPDTAAFISRKLAIHFCADQPPQRLVDDMIVRFRETGGDLPAVYDIMVRHPLARETFGQKVRQPKDLLIAELRALGVTGEEALFWRSKMLVQVYLQPLKKMGQDTYGAPQPKGWPEEAEAWLTPQLLAARIGHAMVLATRMGRPLPDTREFVRNALDEDAADVVGPIAMRAESQGEGIGIVLASPQFNRR